MKNQIHFKKQTVNKGNKIPDYLNWQEGIMINISECVKENIMISDVEYLYKNLTNFEKKKNDYYINKEKYASKTDIEKYKQEAYEQKEQTFLCIKHNGKYNERDKSYQILMEEIKLNQYQIDGIQKEQYRLGRWKTDDKNKYITNIMIPIKVKE